MPIAIVKTGRILLKREVVLIVILTDQSSSHKKPLLILSMRICGQFSLKPQLLLVIGSIPFFLASCLQLTLPLQVCSKALAELHKRTYSIFPSRNGVKKEHTSESSFSRWSRLFLVRSSCVLGKWNEEKASSKEAVSKWNDQEIGVREGLCFPRGNTTSTHLQHSGGPIISISSRHFLL